MQASEPTLLVDPATLADDDSDYEYEYHSSETETFYLNLDLTSQNGPIRPPRRRQDPSSSESHPQPPPSETFSPSAIHPSIDEDESALESTETDTFAPERAQILGLHTPNPIVSYQNQIFSCAWADQIGTELVFAHPEVEPDPASEIPTLRHGQDYDLIAANSVKLLGRKANIISGAGFAPSHDQPTAPGVPRKPGPQTNQSRFLERLMSVKQAKGETDPVRTVYSLKREQNLTDRLRGWGRTEEQLADIQRLNDAAQQGDVNAMAALERLYARFGHLDSESAEDHNAQP